MENIVNVNREVSIVAYYFKSGIKRLKCFPKKMEYKGRLVEFSETGLRHPTKKGQRMAYLYEMTDGQTNYQLEYDTTDSSWRLLSIGA